MIHCNDEPSMINQQNQAHLFSLYTPQLHISSWVIGESINIQDQDLLHRISKVLRFQLQDSMVLFDQSMHAQVVLEAISKKNLSFKVQSLQAHQPLQPNVTFFLPLLKKDALEQAVYSLCELGVNSIQLIVTEKSRQRLMHEKEFVRLQNIVVAAAEQSKNYNLSKLFEPISLGDMFQKNIMQPCSILFDPAGVSFFSLHSQIKLKNVGLLVGPEGGLTQQELDQCKKNQFVFCGLTPTVLTAVQAVALGAGLIRLK